MPDKKDLKKPAVSADPQAATPSKDTPPSENEIPKQEKPKSLKDKLSGGRKLFNSKKTIALIISLLLLIIVSSGVIFYKTFTDAPEGTPQTEKKIVIGLSMGTLRTERWERDKELIIEYAGKNNAVVNVEIANENNNLQITQAENLINQGVEVLIVVPHDAEVTAQIVDMAHEAGIKVIAYDRMIQSEDLDYYVSFDSVKVGEFQAQGVLDVVNKGKFAYIGGSELDNNAFLLKEGSYKLLQPLIDKGDIEIVVDAFSPGWRHEEAYKTINNYLKTGGELDAVVAANDGTATGAIQALSEYDLAGKVPVSGQDAELTACKRLVSGTQSVTVYKPIRLLAEKAVEIAVASVNGETVKTNSSVSNNLTDVPSFLIESILVTKDNLEETVIKDGFHSYEDVFGTSE